MTSGSNSDNPEKLSATWMFERTSQDIGNGNLEYNNLRRYSGCVLEMVRSFFAEWIKSTSVHSRHQNWTPYIPSHPFQFSTFSSIGQAWDRKIINRWRWECQCVLQERIANMERSEMNLPASLELILLFLLGLPENMLCDTNRNILQFIHRGPQDIEIEIEIFHGASDGEEKSVEVKLVPGETVAQF